MDALPMSEDTGLPYASELTVPCTRAARRARAMLVAAARLLALRTADLHGTVRFHVPAGEEGFHGARHMIDAGLLEQPNVDARIRAARRAQLAVRFESPPAEAR